MGAVDCPVCRQVRHIDDQGIDCCWYCGFIVPVDEKTGEYLGRDRWADWFHERRLRALGISDDDLED